MTSSDTRRIFMYCAHFLFFQIIGLAVHNGVFLDVGFPLVVYKKLLNRPLTLQDLAETDPVYPPLAFSRLLSSLFLVALLTTLIS
jgi:hypothetical protein